MAIKVSFLTGANTATAIGLYQWDYGQILEIECSELGSEIVEVHFACANMSEAIVRTCAFTNGVGTVTIPDECLEQTSAVTAWVYKVDSTQGHTVKAITLPITARTRPSNTRSVPADYNDKYGQLIEEVNEAIDAIEKGNVTAAKALSAQEADHAVTAGSAVSATHATSADSATRATAVITKSKTATLENLVAGSNSISGSVELDANSTYMLTAPDGTGGYMTFVLHTVQNKSTEASATSYAKHHLLSYNHQTKKLFLRRYKFFDNGEGIGFDIFSTGTLSVTYAKIALLT